MTGLRQGSFRLFRFAGIQVCLHWSWFLLAAYAVGSRAQQYSSGLWGGLEFVSLFAIVLMHEFGHALACRQVGGQAEQIILWPLGGVAYVNPPSRPGALLWSIAAGPLVNVILVPILSLPALFWLQAGPDAHSFFVRVWQINLVILVFNLLPVYPLDGGQILRALLWFAVGRARSLMVATLVGFVGVAALLAAALLLRAPWFLVLAGFMLLNCWGGLLHARLLVRVAKAPRHEGFRCPDCQTAPPQGDFWRCGQCRKPFDTFRTGAVCPHCGAIYSLTHCPECGGNHPMPAWLLAAPVPPPLPGFPPPLPPALPPVLPPAYPPAPPRRPGPPPLPPLPPV